MVFQLPAKCSSRDNSEFEQYYRTQKAALKGTIGTTEKSVRLPLYVMQDYAQRDET